MPRLDTLLAVHGVHEKSHWSHVGCRRAYDALLEAADLERGARLPSEIRGETVLRALANCGLSVDRRDVSRRLLASILVDVRDARAGEEGRGRGIERERPSEERPSDAPSTAIARSRAGPNTLTLGSSVSLPRFAALLALQCGGEFDEKLDVLFFAANGSDGNVRSDGRLTESQTVDALAKHASPVFKAAARSTGDTGDVEWMKQAWIDVVRAHFARAPGGSFCDASRFRALASEAMHVVSELAEEEEADAPSGGSGAETFPEYVASPRKTNAPRRQNAGSGPPSAAAGIADVLASFAGGSHGGSRDGGSASVRGSWGGDERPGHHRRNTSYESAVGDFGGRGAHAGPASFAGGPASSARRHRRGKSEGTALTPARPGGKAEGGVLWQMLSSFSAGYTKGRSKTAGNESEMFDPNISSSAGNARAKDGKHILSRGAFGTDDGDESDSPVARLSPIDSPRSPRSPSGDLRKTASFGALERVGYSASPDKKQIGRRRPRRHSGVSFDADAVSGETEDVTTKAAADGEAKKSGGPREEEVEEVEDDDEEEDEDDEEEDSDSDDEYAATRHGRVPPKTRAERERLELRLAVASARDETYKAEGDQTEQGAEFESAIAFAQEVGIRMFLYNIVKMLLVIALIAADASICVWTMFHFGIVVGLSVVMVINVGLALLFGFFVLRYTARERGMMHMEYGQHAFKNMTDLFDQNNVKSLGESLAMVQNTMQEGNEREGARGARGADKGTRRVDGV